MTFRARVGRFIPTPGEVIATLSVAWRDTLALGDKTAAGKINRLIRELIKRWKLED